MSVWSSCSDARGCEPRIYLSFYGLKENPFNASPDPRFLYMSPAHREALAQLVCATRERKGYRPGIGHTRESPAFEILAALRRADVSYSDPHVPRRGWTECPSSECSSPGTRSKRRTVCSSSRITPSSTTLPWRNTRG